jgi:manganese transport protein
LEAVITAMVGVIAFCYLIELGVAHPDWGQVAVGSLCPRFAGPDSVVLAAGILGATVMPHVIFLHSALTQGRIVPRNTQQMRLLYRYELVDVVVAMSLAGAINAAMLIMAASTFFDHGLAGIGTIEEAYRTLQPLLGRAASVVFGISLLASGLSSSSVGTMAGQVIMQGFLHRRFPVWFRRLVTILPALIVIAMGVDATRSMVISQVVLSFGLPFAIVPLVMFTASRKIMGPMVNHRITTAAASACAVSIVALNAYLLYRTFFEG